MTERQKFTEWLLTWHAGVIAEPGVMLRWLDDESRHYIVEIENLWIAWQAALASDGRRPMQEIDDAIAELDATCGPSGLQTTIRWVFGGPDNLLDIAVARGRELREASETKSPAGQSEDKNERQPNENDIDG